MVLAFGFIPAMGFALFSYAGWFTNLTWPLHPVMKPDCFLAMSKRGDPKYYYSQRYITTVYREPVGFYLSLIYANI